MLWQMMSEFYSILFGRVRIPSHDIFHVTVFHEMANYFVEDNSVVVVIVCLICFGQVKFPRVVSVTIASGSFLRTRCFGRRISADGILNIILDYCQSMITYCNKLIRA